MPILRRGTPLLLALSLAACTAADDAAETPRAAAGPDSATVESDKPVGPRVTDADIVAIVAAANDADIRNAAVAREHSREAVVLEFAQTMADAHTAVNGQATALATRLGVTARENEISAGIARAQELERTRIATLSGAEFDRAYLDNEVAYHMQVIDAFDQVLLPSVTNPELKTLLEQTRPAVAAHLQRARELQASFEQ
jgi:putative membrane protein